MMADSMAIAASSFQALLGASFLLFAFGQFLSVPAISCFGLYRTAGISSLYLIVAVFILAATSSSYAFAFVFLSMFVMNSIGSNATRVALRNIAGDEGFRRTYAYATSAVEIVQIAMPLVAGLIAARYGWQTALIALVAPVTMAGVLMIWLPSAEQNIHQTAAFWSDWKIVLTLPSFLKPFAIAAAFQVAIGPLNVQLPFILTDIAGLSTLQAGLALSLSSVAIACGFLVAGWLAARTSSSVMLIMALLLTTAGWACMLISFTTGVYALVAGILIVQLAYGPIMVPCSGDAMNVPENLRAIASAIFGFTQPVVGGLSVLTVGITGVSATSASITVTGIAGLALLGLLYFGQTSAAGR